MANPNILSVNTIRGKTLFGDVTTSATTFMTNAASSGELIKINSLLAINRGGDQGDLTIKISKNGTLYFLANAMTVPTNSNLVLLTRDMQWYLEENDFIQAFCSVANTITLACSYESIL
jgi:hypothetical protein